MSPISLSRAVRWPLWSWRNLAVSSAVALLVLFGIGRLTNTGDPASAATSTPPPSTAASAPSPATTPTAPAPTTSPTTAAPTTTSSPGSGAAFSPVKVATAFVTAWADTTAGQEAWLAGMKPWTTPSLLGSLTGTDPTQVPATKVVGDAALLKTTGSNATVTVPTDGGRVAVTMVTSGGVWKANGIAPYGAPPGAPTPGLEPNKATTTSPAG